MEIRRAAILAFALWVSSGMLMFAQPRPMVMRWFTAVNGAKADGNPPRQHRVFDEPMAVQIELTMFNESASDAMLDASEFADRVKVRLLSPSDIPIEFHWTETWRPSSQSGMAVRADRILLEPGSGVHWSLVIRRSDNTAFERGAYDVHLRLAEAFQTLTGRDGERWVGTFAPETTLRVTVGPPQNAEERAQVHRLRGLEALREKRGVEAQQRFAAGLKETPQDRDLLIGLGDAYMSQNRYRDAISAYEQVLPLIKGLRTGVQSTLALAYLGVGDEQSALRVLRAQEWPEHLIAAELANLRKALAQRAKK